MISAPPFKVDLSLILLGTYWSNSFWYRFNFFSLDLISQLFAFSWWSEDLIFCLISIGIWVLLLFFMAYRNEICWRFRVYHCSSDSDYNEHLFVVKKLNNVWFTNVLRFVEFNWIFIDYMNIFVNAWQHSISNTI